MSLFSRLLGRPDVPPVPVVRPTVELRAAPGTAPAPDLGIVTGMATDTGCVREINEDAIRVLRHDAQPGQPLLVAVCDGMGGHEGGEVASRLAMEALMAGTASEDPDAHAVLTRAVQAANTAVFTAADREPRLRGMGTTCTVLHVHRGMAACAHVGDSRCYMLRDGELFLMTEDHSAVMDMVRRGLITRDEARTHPEKNVISRALGSHRTVEVTRWPQVLQLRAGDQFLLCSDGLYDLVSDEAILAAMLEHAPQAACDALVEQARANGGFDNISVAILAVRPLPAPGSDVKATRVVEAT